MFRTKKIFITHETRFLLYELSGLPNYEVVQWLEKNKYEYNEQSLENEYPEWHEFIEYIWHRRKNRHINIAICRYGKNERLLRKFKRKKDKTLLRCLLTNSHINWLFSEEELKKIITNFPSTKNELTILFSNKYVHRDFFVKFFEDIEFLFKKENEVCAAFCLSLISKNPKLKEKYDETIMDGWAHYRFGQLEDVFPTIIMDSPVSPIWQEALEILFKELPFKKYLPERIDPEKFLKKWKDTKEEKEKAAKERFNVNRKYYFRLEFLKFYINNILFMPRHEGYLWTTFPNFLVPDHKEKLYREAFFSFADYNDWFYYTEDDKEVIVVPNDFDYPEFNENSEYFRKDPKKIKIPKFENPDFNQLLLTKIISAYKKDGEEFVEWLMRNKNFWKERKHREFLHNIAWNLCHDEHSDMRMPNIFNLCGDKFFEEYPDYFKDEEVAENDELKENNQPETEDDLLKIYNSKRFDKFTQTGFSFSIDNILYSSSDDAFGITIDDLRYGIVDIERICKDFITKSGLNFSELAPYINERIDGFDSFNSKIRGAIIIINKMDQDYSTEETIKYDFTGYDFNKENEVLDGEIAKKFNFVYKDQTFHLDTAELKIFVKLGKRNFDVLKYFVQNNSSKNLDFQIRLKNEKDDDDEVLFDPSKQGDMLISYTREVLFNCHEISFKKEIKKEDNLINVKNDIQNEIYKISEEMKKISQETKEYNFDQLHSLRNIQEEIFDKKFKKINYYFWIISILLIIVIIYK